MLIMLSHVTGEIAQVTVTHYNDVTWPTANCNCPSGECDRQARSASVSEDCFVAVDRSSLIGRRPIHSDVTEIKLLVGILESARHIHLALRDERRHDDVVSAEHVKTEKLTMEFCETAT